MRPAAALTLAGASVYWLLHRRNNRQPKQQAGISGAQPAGQLYPADDNGTAAQQSSNAPHGQTPALSVMPVIGSAVALVLLLAATALAGQREAWDLFGLLLAASVLTLFTKALRRGEGAGAAAREHQQQRHSSEGSMTHRADQLSPMQLIDLRIQGEWIKDNEASTPMDEACSVMRLNGLVRTAVRLVRGVEVSGFGYGRFDFAVFSVIPWFKVRESYKLGGAVGRFARRDLRRGKHAASVTVQPDGSVLVSVSWDEPMGGHGTDVFSVRTVTDANGVTEERLLVASRITVGGRTVSYDAWYRRRR